MYPKTTTSYSNRTVDLLLLQLVPTPVADQKVTTSVANTPHITTGIEKLVQRYALLFLTELGSIQNRPLEGTEILTIMGQGRIYDESTLRSAAAAANKQVIRQIKGADQLDPPVADEALDTAEVTNLSLDRNTASVTIVINITSVAGETYTYVSPLKVGI